MLRRREQETDAALTQAPKAWKRSSMRFALPFLVLLLAGCGGGRNKPLRLDMPPLILAPIQQSHVADGRGRYREILVAVRDARNAPDPQDPDGVALLHRLADEPAPTGRPVHLGRARTRLRVLVVPGLLGDIIGAWVMPFAHGLARLEKYGFKTGYLWVSGSASCAYNAEMLKEAFLGIELAPRGITVNAVSPGFIETDMVADLPMDKILPFIPLGRAGSGNDIAHMTVFLCSDQGAWITGQSYNVDGGTVVQH